LSERSRSNPANTGHHTATRRPRRLGVRLEHHGDPADERRFGNGDAACAHRCPRPDPVPSTARAPPPQRCPILLCPVLIACVLRPTARALQTTCALAATEVMRYERLETGELETVYETETSGVRRQTRQPAGTFLLPQGCGRLSCISAAEQSRLFGVESSLPFPLHRSAAVSSAAGAKTGVALAMGRMACKQGARGRRARGKAHCAE